jgi:hypothetical protein
MNKLLLHIAGLLAFWMLLSGFIFTPPPPFIVKSGPAIYQGPGNIVTSALGWWGLRGYSLAYSTGSNNAAQVCDTATGLTCSTIVILANGNFDSATASASLACAVACSVVTLYDQSGNAHNMTCSPIGVCPALAFNCLGVLPCMTFLGSSSQIMNTGALTSSAQQNTYSAVAQRTGTFTAVNTVFDTATFGTALYFTASANTCAVYPGTTALTATCNDSTWHAMNALLNGSSSIINVDGSESSPGGAGTNGTGTPNRIGGSTTAAQYLTGTFFEAGTWHAASSSTQRNALCHNQNAYWSLGLSC